MRTAPALLVLLVSAGCGAASAPGSGTSAAATTGAPTAPAVPAARGGEPGPALAGHTRVLTDPDAGAMVFLYYDLAGLKPPIDEWVEEDSRVKFAPPIERAAHRTAVRAELEAGLAAVHGVGELHLSMNANLSDYDPSYGEFTVGVFAPSSILTFDALGQKVTLKFANARAAQTWKVAPADAQAVRDRVSAAGNITADAVLRIGDVQPGSGGGAITVQIMEYELREARTGHALARIQPSRT